MRTRLIAAFLLVVVVSTGTVILLTNLRADSEIRRFAARGGMMGVENLVNSLETYYKQNGSWTNVADVVEMPMMMGNPRHNPQSWAAMRGSVIIADENGIVVFNAGSIQRPANLNNQEIQNAVPISMSGKTVGYLYTGTDPQLNSEIIDALVNRATNAALTAAIIAGVISLILASGLAYAITRPIQTLTQAAAHMANGDLAQRVDIQSRDEIGALAHAFNHMAESLSRLENNRKAMTADIAHELRTPLAVQRANIEALQDGIFPLEGENLAPLLAQNQILERLVDDLRTLALADAGQLHLEQVPIRMNSLVKEFVMNFSAQASVKNIEIIMNLPETCPDVLADPSRIAQVLSNLLSNAIRYTPENQKIWIEVGFGEQSVTTSIVDSGPGIPPESLPNVFERFYRADKARTREDGGTGLGLAIARRLVEAHGGQMHAENVPSGGARFQFSLPTL